jgi:hypothetical protein
MLVRQGKTTEPRTLKPRGSFFLWFRTAVSRRGPSRSGPPVSDISPAKKAEPYSSDTLQQLPCLGKRRATYAHTHSGGPQCEFDAMRWHSHTGERRQRELDATMRWHSQKCQWQGQTSPTQERL